MRKKKLVKEIGNRCAETTKGFVQAIRLFFFTKGKFNPLRYLITVFSHLCIITVLCRLVGCSHISDEFVGIMVGLIPLLIGADTWRQNTRDQYIDPRDQEEGQP